MITNDFTAVLFVISTHLLFQHMLSQHI